MPVGVVSRQNLIRIVGETHGVGAGPGHVDSCAVWRDWNPHLSDSKLCRRSRKVTRMAEAVREALLRIKALGWASTAADAACLHHLSDAYGFARPIRMSRIAMAPSRRTGVSRRASWTGTATVHSSVGHLQRVPCGASRPERWSCGNAWTSCSAQTRRSRH